MSWWKFKLFVLFSCVFLVGMSVILAACIWWQLLGGYLGAEECLWDAVFLALISATRLVRRMPPWRLGLLCLVLSTLAWVAYMAKQEQMHRALHAAYIAAAMLWMISRFFDKYGKKWLTKLQSSALTMVNAASFRREVNEAAS